MKIALILTAAGMGSRFGSNTPKALHLFGDQPLLIWALHPFLEFPAIQEIWITTPPHYQDTIQKMLTQSNLPAIAIEGGATRQESVQKAILQSSQVDAILIHDAARPMVTPALIARILKAGKTHPAVIPAIDVTDTIKEVYQNQVVKTLNRSTLKAIQTPQFFRKDLLLQAYQQPSAHLATDEATLIEKLGIPVVVVEGDRKNIKVTYPEDKFAIEKWLTTPSFF